MSVDRTGIQDVHALWLQTLDFLRCNAPQMWTDMLRQGGGDILDAAHRGGTGAGSRSGRRPGQRGKPPATQSRLVLHHAGSRRERRRADRHPVHRPDRQHCALTLRTDGVGRAAGTRRRGVALRAVSWGPAYDGGTWWSWWTDTAACVRAGIAEPSDADDPRRADLPRGVHAEPDFWPVQADDPACRSTCSSVPCCSRGWRSPADCWCTASPWAPARTSAGICAARVWSPGRCTV